MIDMNKKYTYQGKPVRIYADGSDTDNSTIHGAYKSETSGRWVLNIFNDSELVEAWEPKEGEVIITKGSCGTIVIEKYSNQDVFYRFTGDITWLQEKD